MEEHHMVVRGDRVIAGVSGGADSVCLFFVLLEIRKALGFDLVAVHVNHGLRGDASDADEGFVRKLCRRYHVPLEVFCVELELIAKKRKQSLEEAGRCVRREAFLAALEKHGASKIALAHHQDDNAETLLWNLCRGSGLTGMGGIRPVNGVYIHPLLCMTRKEIEDFLKGRGQDYRTDETNAGTDFTRNRLRHVVLPMLEREINSQSVRHMNETTRQMLELREYVDLQAQKAVEECTVWEGAGDCLIKKESFCACPRVLRPYVLRGCVERLRGELTDFGQVHVEALSALFDKQVGRRICLPAGMEARRVYDGVELRMTAGCVEARRDLSFTGGMENLHDISSAGNMEALRDLSAVGEAGTNILNIPGETCFPERGLVVRCKIVETPAQFSMKEIPENIYTKWFDYGIIKKGLCIRGRKPGDSIVIDKEGHAKKLKSWFINEKIPADKREEVLLLACGNDVLWIIGYRMSSAYQISDQTRQILQVEVCFCP